MTSKKKEEKTEIEVADKQEIDDTAGEPTWAGTFFSPRVDITSSDTGLTLVADLPGVGKDGLDIDLREGVLTLLGKVEELSPEWRPLQQEYRLGGYLRRFNISDDIDREAISATLNDGVLILDLPKLKEAQPRKIQVQVG